MRAALDLLAQVGALPPGDVIDLGCGDGAVGPALAMRFPERRLIGVDASPAMLAAARGDPYARLIQADIAHWTPAEPPVLIFSNAALHWLDDHARLMPRLAWMLAPRGVLAVQMPGQHDAPSHRVLREIGAELAPGAIDPTAASRVQGPLDYARMLAPFGRVAAWETTYVQHLDASPDGHPVRHFVQSTAMRPILERLRPADHRTFLAAVDAAMEREYPRAPDGSVLFPFRRVFFVLETP